MSSMEKKKNKKKKKKCVSIVARGRDGSYMVHDYDTTVNSIFSEISRVSGKDDFLLFYEGVELKKGYPLSRYNVESGCDVYMVESEYILSHRDMWNSLLTMALFSIRLQADNKSVEADDQSLVTDVIHWLFAKFVEDGDDLDVIVDYLHMLESLCIAKLLCNLSKSSPDNTPVTKLARVAIGTFFRTASLVLPPSVAAVTAPFMLRFLDELNGTQLLKMCRRNFAKLVESFINFDDDHNVWRCLSSGKLCLIVENHGLDLEGALNELAYPSSNASRFNLKTADSFACLVGAVIKVCLLATSVPIPLQPKNSSPIRRELMSLYKMFCNLYTKAGMCLERLKSVDEDNAIVLQACDFLLILKTLYHISHLFIDGTKRMENMFKKYMREMKTLVNQFTLNGEADSETHSWLLTLKDSLGFVCRSNLAMSLFKRFWNNAYADLTVYINRAELLCSSVEAINQVSLKDLQQGLKVKFDNEDGEGPGVFTEWMIMVFKDLFAPKNGPRLFITNEEDGRTFYLNSRFMDENGTRDYFHFFGRMLGLALKHRVRIGVRFHQVLFAQFVGNEVTLKDIKAADLTFYKSCKEMLKMSADKFRETLALEVEDDDEPEKVVKKKVNDRFMDTSCLEVQEMAKGFADTIGSRKRQSLFFQFLTLDDLNRMIGVDTAPLPLDEWRRHTDCIDYVETDLPIQWFWKIVSEMTEEESRRLLHFWTSIKYIPIDGFVSLGNRLKIKKVSYVHRTLPLPVSHTCSLQIDIPDYPSFEMMKNCIDQIVMGDLDFGFTRI